ncbi:EboA domain-containing protein [Pontibacter sp. G13]|uniref:EboA domain-containing protein n=1 Tax=Pontibacter sp. G13 TaxID=3074898 RepID=UPI0028895964|nr:EboA domain-containing protein [Pontibacter sp. G13]WNJ20605.1 EboA domain-containing protein [Pontibacter sp. G13]
MEEIVQYDRSRLIGIGNSSNFRNVLWGMYLYNAFFHLKKLYEIRVHGQISTISPADPQPDFGNTMTMRSFRSLLYDHLVAHLDNSTQKNWLDQKLASIEQNGLTGSFFLAFSGAPRFLPKGLVPFSESQLADFAHSVESIHPERWTFAEAVRILFLLSLPQEDPEQFKASILEVFDTADMGEQRALYQSLPVLPHPDQFSLFAAEGIRTNMTTVLEAIVLDNPYPAQYLNEGAWNQLFLKAAFTDRPIHRIVEVDRRANATLARIVSDYAHERWSAGRVVSPELWRVVPPFATEQSIRDAEALFAKPEKLQQVAAMLICQESDLPEAKSLLAQHPKWAEAAEAGDWNWDKLGQQWENHLQEA